MATFTERKEQVATWDGSQSLWLDYVKRVRLQYERTPYHKRKLLGAELASRLTGRAWDVTSADIDHARLQQRDGPAYLLQFLEQRLCKAPIPDSGQRLEDFFIRLRRRPGSSMTEWASQLRESYRRLQRALARQRHDRGEQVPKPEAAAAASPTSQRMRSTPESRRRRSDVTSPQRQESEEWQAFPEIPREREVNTGGRHTDQRDGDEEQQHEPNEEEEEEEHYGYRRVPASDRESTSDWHQPRWTHAEWQAWYRWKSWKDKSWDSGSEEEGDEPPIRWEQFEFSDVQVLPTEILGWLLLRRSGLPASARLSVLSAINNSLDLDTMERAMRDQEEELLLAESARSHHQLPKPRRSFWIEQDSSWGLVNDFDPEEIEDSAIMWVGSQLPEEVYGKAEAYYNDSWSTLPGGQELHWEWFEDDFYAEDQDGVFWSWSETKDWMDIEECYAAAPEAAEDLQEAYNAFQTKMRSFKESRFLNNAKQLSRGYYPFSSFKGKSKGKGKTKGKGFGKKGTMATPSTASSASVVAFGQKGGSGQRPGNPEYRGCFICGSKEHDFRSCPKRQGSQSSASRSSNLVQAIYMVQSVKDEMEAPSPTSFVVLSDSENEEKDEPGVAMATLALEFPGHAIIDSGATGSIGSLEALEQIMTLRTRKYGQEEVKVHERQKRFRFGNGESKKAASYVEIPQQVNGQKINLGIHALDAPGVPLLLSVKTLTKMQAVVDFGKSRMCLCSVSPTCWIPLKKVANGHLLIDLTQDWFKDQPEIGRAHV